MRPGKQNGPAVVGRAAPGQPNPPRARLTTTLAALALGGGILLAGSETIDPTPAPGALLLGAIVAAAGGAKLWLD